MSIATALNVSVFTLESYSAKAVATSAGLRFVNRTTDGRVISDANAKNCITKKAAILRYNGYSEGATCKVGGLDVTALSIGGQDYLARCISLGFDVQNEFKQADGIGDTWEALIFAGQSLTAKATLNVGLTVNRALMTAAASGTLSNCNITFTVTINSITVTIPMVIQELEHSFDAGDIQKWDLVLGPRGAASAPAGTSTPLELALNVPGTSQTLALQTKASTGGIIYGGEFMVESYSMNVSNGALLGESFTFRSTGAVTEGASS